MKRFEIPVLPARAQNVVNFGGARITILTDRLFRVERGATTDLPSQTVWNRDLGEVDFRCQKQGSALLVTTPRVSFRVGASGKVSSVCLDGKPLSTRGNLKGTARTLDHTDGPTPLDRGLIAKGGLAILEDKGLLLKDGGFVERGKGVDQYWFAYGADYRAALRDFYRLSGATPLIPRYALGNWWSRYKAYTQQEYLDVLDKFASRFVPITVATVDMDWHWTDVVKRFGKDAKPTPTDNIEDKFMVAVVPFIWNGWTGYSWNTELFPDHLAFLEELHRRGHHVTLNVHPSHGVRFFEDHYADYCKIVGIDPSSKAPVPFKLGERKYVEGYFDAIHHPLEEEGVDFWWLDWQQGKRSDVKGLDPLWALNHYHYLDSGRGNKRPLILSRYAGVGSHRYPLGFSGDSCMDWKTLRFQPYFTANAANVGYTWWSHDIGGHHRYGKNDELYLRWVQFGVFSPINRLHSTANEFMGKEPWKCAPHIETIVNDYLRLRHSLIPYIYSQAYRTAQEGIALCEPMYYGDPQDPHAYQVPNEYRFGSQLIVAPVTSPVHARSGLAKVKVWLPQGEYVDLFTGRRYQGGREYTVYRPLTQIPVFALSGAIVPTYRDGKHNDLSLTQDLDLWLWAGDGSFDLYEDDGESNEYQTGKYAITPITQKRTGDTLTLTIGAVRGDASVLPAKRVVWLDYKDLSSTGLVTVDGVPQESNDGIRVEFDPRQGAVVVLKGYVLRHNPDLKEEIIDLVSRYQGNNTLKLLRYGKLVKDPFAKVCAPSWARGPIEEARATCAKNPQKTSK